MSHFNFWVYQVIYSKNHLCACFESEDDAKDFARTVEKKGQYSDAYVMDAKTGARWYVSDNKSRAQELAEYRAWFRSEFEREPRWDELYADGFIDDCEEYYDDDCEEF